MSKTALSVVKLVVYLVLLLQLLLEPHDRQSKFRCAAQFSSPPADSPAANPPRAANPPPAAHPPPAANPPPAAHAPAPAPANLVLVPDQVSALQTVTTNLNFRGEEIKKTLCSNFVSNYGLEVDCTCSGQQCWVYKLTMSNLGLTGVIQDAIGQLTSLHILVLSNNKLHGSIPDTLGNLRSLETLDLSNNQLSGSIPANLGNLGSLQWLYLQYNLLSGVIPQSFGSLWKLEQLYLHFNRLSGSIPDQLGDLSKLVYLDMSENQLIGHLPASLGNLIYLRSLWVPANYLNGEFPNTYDSLTNLRSFSISGNYISGPLPVKTIAKWTYLKSLSLLGNNFEGIITEEIFNLPMLQYLLVSDLTNPGFQFPEKISNSANLFSVILRNCSITGRIPKYVGEEMSSIRYLDLSFNNLTGVLPEYMTSNMVYMSFANNQLNGTIPDWILRNVDTSVDLSFNNFSKVDTGESSNPQLNLFACCRKSSTTASDMMDPSDMKHKYCPGDKAKHHSLFINCGGGETSYAGNKYDQDNVTSRAYTSPKRNWAYSLTGNFGVAKPNTSDYIKNITCGISVPEAPLYDKARISPLSLKYYAYCLRKGKYNVTLDFAEIIYTDDADYSSLRKRAFDVYIQGERRLSYFDIKRTAKGVRIPITRNFSGVDVNDSLLEIHLYWPGKGSIEYWPSFSGPLISAISVTPEFKIEDGKHKALDVALITTASVLAALLLLVAFAWWMGWLGSKKWPTIEIGQEKVEVTLKELIDATGNFSKENELGRGTSGAVYKAKLQGHIVAVKKLDSSEFKTKMEELKTEIGTIKSLQHSSFLRLWDVYIGKDRQLFVYEYMENKSLADVLFGRKKSSVLTWDKRSEICLGIAKALESLHNHPRTEIIHSNIKTANILLDQDLQPKISDFRFASLYTLEDQVKIITTEVPQGYMAPECFQKNVTLTSKVDVYSFGVVILEIVCGQRNILNNATQETILLLDRACEARQGGYLHSLVDRRLSHYDEKEATNILSLAVLCTNRSPIMRPAMSVVVCALLGQKTIDEVSPPPPKLISKLTRTATGTGSATSTEFSLPSASSPSTGGPQDFT